MCEVRPEYAQGRAPQSVRQRAGPLSALHALGLERDVAPRGDDQRQSELRRRHRRIAHSGRDRDTELGGGGKVQHVRGAPDQCDQAELRQPGEERTGKCNALADRYHHIRIGEACDKLIEIARRLAVAHDVMMTDERKRCKPVHHVLIVIRNNDFHRSALLFAARSSAWFTANPDRIW